MGLMQLMPATAREYKVRNAYDPKANIDAGVKHLKSLIDRFDGALDMALAAYNAGEGAVPKFNGIPPYRETRNYVSKILSLAGRIKVGADADFTALASRMPARSAALFSVSQTARILSNLQQAAKGRACI